MTVALAALAVLSGGSAGAVTGNAGEVTMHPTVPAVTVPASSSSGTTALGLTVEQSAIVPSSMVPSLPALPSGEGYLQIWLWPDTPPGMSGWDPITIPNADATVTTAAGTVGPAGSDLQAWDSFVEWDFPVPMSTTSATLTVSAWSATAIAPQSVQDVESGTVPEVPYTLAPLTIGFQADQVPATTTTVPAVGPGTGQRQSEHSKHDDHRPVDTSSRSVASHSSNGGSAATGIGAGLGGLVLLGGGAAALVSLRRRRAFAKADREGRVVLTGPPPFTARPAAAHLPTDATDGVVVPPAGRRLGDIVVKLLGPLVVDGTKHPVRDGPLLEILTYLVLHPGESFTSVQLRASIWTMGRTPISSNTFRVYMVKLRKAFGPGVVVTETYHYRLTETVSSDWAHFQAAVEREDRLAGQAEALSLVRGRVLSGCFDGKKNIPFAWAYDTANRIENEVATTAGRLALVRLDLGDPTGADAALAKGLLCSEADLLLRKIGLEVGLSVGGRRELARRLAAARPLLADYPNELAELEAEARRLGGDNKVLG